MSLKNQTLLTLVLLMASLTPAYADTKTLVCQSSKSESQAQTLVDDFQQRMTIALARGDLATMNQLYNDTFPFLKRCRDHELRQLCSHDCYRQLAQYFLFEALAKNIDKHIAFLERGYKLLDLAKQAAAHPDAAFRGYIQKASEFKYYMAQLYMANADIWYQAESETRIRRLADLIGATSDPQAADDAQSDSNHAGAYYQKARWLVAEALMGLPELKVFDGVRTDLGILQSDLSTRLQSLKKGYLFVNIDPDEYSIFNIPKLQAELDKIAVQVDRIEEKVVALSASWLEAKGAQKAQQIDEQRREQELSTVASAYKIAMLEDMSKDYATDIQAQLETLREKSITFELELRKNRLQFELDMKLDELQQRKVLIVHKKEVDVLQFQQTEVNIRINDLRWLMNWKIATTNLELQISAYLAQIIQYKRELERNRGKKQEIEYRIASNQSRIAIADNHIKEAEAEKTRIEKQRTALFQLARERLEVSICQLERDLAYLGAKPDKPFRSEKGKQCPPVSQRYTKTAYMKNVCGTHGIRKMLQKQKIHSVKQVLVCVIGVEAVPEMMRAKLGSVNCPSGLAKHKPQIAFAKSIAAKEKERAEVQIQAIKAQKEKLQELITTIKANFHKIQFLDEFHGVQVAGAETAYYAASLLPKIVATVMGGAEFDPAEPLFVMYQQTKRIYETTLRRAQSQADFDNKKKELQNALANLNEQLNLANLEKEIRELHTRRTVAEIYGQGLQQSQNWQEFLMQDQLVAQDCQFEQATLDANIATAQSEHRKRLIEWHLAHQRNEQLQFAIDTQNRKIKQEQLQIGIIHNQTKELQTQLAVLENDIKSLKTLRENSQTSINQIRELQGELTGLQRELDAQQMALQRVRKAEFKNRLAFGDKELDYVTRVIVQSKTQTERLKEQIDALIETQQASSHKTQKMLAYQLDISAQIKKERQIILNNIAESRGAGEEKQQLFIATQADIAKLIKGVPTFIQSKRRLMESANRYLNLLRNRVAAMLSVADSVAMISDNLAQYVRTYDDLKALQNLIADQALWSTAPVIIEMTTITVPGASGLANALALNQQASFEISPSARGNQAKRGYFSLWSSNFDPDPYGMNQNLMLIDFHVGIEFKGTCNYIRRPVQITHEGSGFVFKDMSANDPTLIPVFLTKPSRTTKRSYITLNADNKNLVSQLGYFWAQRHYLHNFLAHNSPPDDSGAAMPLMGLPVIGTYELTLSNPPEGCTYEGAEFRFYLVYSKSMRF